MLGSSLTTSHPKEIQRRWCRLAEANKVFEMVCGLEGCKDDAVDLQFNGAGLRALDL